MPHTHQKPGKIDHGDTNVYDDVDNVDDEDDKDDKDDIGGLNNTFKQVGAVVEQWLCRCVVRMIKHI